MPMKSLKSPLNQRPIFSRNLNLAIQKLSNKKRLIYLSLLIVATAGNWTPSPASEKESLKILQETNIVKKDSQSNFNDKQSSLLSEDNVITQSNQKIHWELVTDTKDYETSAKEEHLIVEKEVPLRLQEEPQTKQNSGSEEIIWELTNDEYWNDATYPDQLASPPSLQGMNRSIAFSNGAIGPDIGWKVPNGFRWSERLAGNLSARGFSRRKGDTSFFGWNGGDGTAQIHYNIFQRDAWSFGINSSMRSVYEGNSHSGGGTAIGEGLSSGFRIAKSIGDTAGIAFGGEQIFQWDAFTDTGRNFYLMGSKGWWLNDKNDYPLFIANGGFGTGRFANNRSWDNPFRFACIYDVQNKVLSYAIDNDLCWSPIGTTSIIINKNLGAFLEYNAGNALIGTSFSFFNNSLIPTTLTWGIKVASHNELKEMDELTWFFRTSFAF